MTTEPRPPTPAPARRPPPCSPAMRGSTRWRRTTGPGGTADPGAGLRGRRLHRPPRRDLALLDRRRHRPDQAGGLYRRWPRLHLLRRTGRRLVRRRQRAQARTAPLRRDRHPRFTRAAGAGRCIPYAARRKPRPSPFVVRQLNERMGQFIAMVQNDRLLGADARVAGPSPSSSIRRCIPAPAPCWNCRRRKSACSRACPASASTGPCAAAADGMVDLSYQSIRVTDLEQLRRFGLSAL